MKIVADENIPLVEAFFSPLGDVLTRPGRTLKAEDVRDAEVLLVRSVTRVNRALLDGSKVRFVGTCTIGEDHLDLDYLKQHNIAFTSAPGCNANSVVEYVFSVLAALNTDWRGKVFGIIGCGNVGGRLYQRLQALGVECRCYDPLLSSPSPVNTPLQRDLTSLEAVLAADIISLHTPLTRGGPYPTYHMLGMEQLLTLTPGSLLINSGRGAAIDNQALLRILQRRDDLTVALDVWEPEPALNPSLLERVALGTPHIAGYSYDGKVAGTAMVHRALCRFLSLEVEVPQDDVPAPAPLIVNSADAYTQLREAVLQAYDVRQDDRRLRWAAADVAQLPKAFDALRKNYPRRLEFSNYVVQLPDVVQQPDGHPGCEWLGRLGFMLKTKKPPAENR